MNIYVSNLGFDIESESLKKAFSDYGVVSSVNIIIDKFTNRNRGFAFVEMPDAGAAEMAIRELNGSMLQGRTMKANVASQRDPQDKKNTFY